MGITFQSIEHFYKATREDRIEELIRTLNTENKDPSEEAWRESLPDFAEMLWTPDKYIEKTVEKIDDMTSYIEADNDEDAKPILAPLPAEIELMVSGTTYQEWREYWERELQEILREAIRDERNNRGKLCFEELKEQRNTLKEFKTEKTTPEGEGTEWLPPGISVEIEHTYDDGTKRHNQKSADVILRKDNKELVIELKQWTESNIVYEDNTLKIYSKDKRTQHESKHPLLQAMFYSILEQINQSQICDVNISWRKMKEKGSSIENPECLNLFWTDQKWELKHDTDDDACEIYIIDKLWEMMTAGEADALKKNLLEKPVFPIVYLHNQYYDGGLLFEKKPQNLQHYYYEKEKKLHGSDSLWKGGIYTRHKCNVLLEFLKAFFSEEDYKK